MGWRVERTGLNDPPMPWVLQETSIIGLTINSNYFHSRTAAMAHAEREWFDDSIKIVDLDKEET
jgi:hypothetical protein